MKIYYAYKDSKDYTAEWLKVLNINDGEQKGEVEKDSINSAFYFILHQGIKEFNLYVNSKSNLRGFIRSIINEKGIESLYNKKLYCFDDIKIYLMTDRIKPDKKNLPILACYMTAIEIEKLILKYHECNSIIWAPSSQKDINTIKKKYEMENISLLK